MLFVCSSCCYRCLSEIIYNHYHSSPTSCRKLNGIQARFTKSGFRFVNKMHSFHWNGTVKTRLLRSQAICILYTFFCLFPSVFFLHCIVSNEIINIPEKQCKIGMQLQKKFIQNHMPIKCTNTSDLEWLLSTAWIVRFSDKTAAAYGECKPLTGVHG